MDGVVGQVHELVVNVAQVVNFAGGPDVTFREEVDIEVVGDKHPHADVKLAAADQKRVLNVLLDDELVAFDERTSIDSGRLD